MRCAGKALVVCAGLTLSCGNLEGDHEPSAGTGGAPVLHGTCVDTPEPVQLVELTPDYPVPQAEFLAVDATHVYFTEPIPGVVARVGLCGGPVEELATKRSAPFQVALDDDFVFWTEGGTTPFDGKLMRMDKKGGPFFEVPDVSSPGGLAVDSKSVFYAANGTWRWDKLGGLPPAQLAQRTGYANLALDDGFVYFSTSRVPKQGGATETLATTDPLVWCSAVDEQWLYWTEYWDGGVWKVAKTGGTKTQLLPVGPWRCLAAGGGYVYAASDDGVYRVTSDGSGATKIGEGGTGVALDASYVYWAGKGGIWRASR